MNLGLIITLGFVLTFILFWMFIMFLISKISGWSKIAKAFPFTEMNAGMLIEKSNFNSMMIGYQTKLNGMMTIRFYEHGIRIKPMKLFGAFFSPIFFDRAALKKGTFRGTEQMGVFQLDVEGKQIMIVGTVAPKIDKFTKSKNPYF
jgi:hypothetical protein